MDVVWGLVWLGVRVRVTWRAIGKTSSCDNNLPFAVRLAEVPSVPKKAVVSAPLPVAASKLPDKPQDLIDMFDWLEADESDSKVTFQVLHRDCMR